MARRIRLVLCGGGVRGLAHAGVLVALERATLRPHVLVGILMGAIVAATRALNPGWYAALRELHKHPPPLPALDPAARPGPLGRLLLPKRTLAHMFTGWGIGEEAVGWARQTLEALTLGRRLEEADPAVIDTAADLETGRRVALREGPASEALYATTALAGILPPARTDGRLLVDGGYADLAPVDLAWAAGAQFEIAVDVAAGAPVRPPTNGVSAMLRSFEICQAHHARLRLAEADMLLPPKFLAPIDTLEIGKARMAMAAGLRAGRAALARLRQDAGTTPPRSDTPEKS